MAKFTIILDANHAAFDDGNMQYEIARILRNIADKAESAGFSGFFETIRDINGNDVGRYAMKNDDGSNYNG